jgi:hypothetical protein
MAPDDCLGQPAGGRFVRNVDAVPFEARSMRPGSLDQVVEFRWRSIRCGDDRAFAQEGQADRAAEAAGAACHEADCPREPVTLLLHHYPRSRTVDG